MIGEITWSDIEADSFVLIGRIGFGAEGTGYQYQGRRFPRVQYVDRFFDGRARAERRQAGERCWYVDGQKIEGGPDNILARLAEPPVLTDSDEQVLEFIAHKFTRRGDIERALFGDSPKARLMTATLLKRLSLKGLIEFGPMMGEETTTSDHVVLLASVRRRKCPAR